MQLSSRLSQRNLSRAGYVLSGTKQNSRCGTLTSGSFVGILSPRTIVRCCDFCKADRRIEASAFSFSVQTVNSSALDGRSWLLQRTSCHFGAFQKESRDSPIS
jgi:hypothetical protein